MRAIRTICCLMLCGAMSGPAAAKGACATLIGAAAQTCTARVNCAPFEAHLDTAEALFRRCAAGEEVTQDEVDRLFALFHGARNFRCCVGNALYRKYIVASDKPVEGD